MSVGAGIVAGLIIGWIIEWIIDWRFWRTPPDAEVSTDVEQLRVQLAASQRESEQLRTRLDEIEQAKNLVTQTGKDK